MKPNLVIQPTPVVFAMKFIIAKERSMTSKPTIAHVRVLRAPSVCLGSPPEKTNLNPEIIIRTRANIPAPTRSQKMTLPTIIGTQASVATLSAPPTKQLSDVSFVGWAKTGVAIRRNEEMSPNRIKSLFIREIN